MADPVFNLENAVEVDASGFDINNAVEVDSEPAFDINNAVVVNEPQKTVFVEERNQVVAFPDNYDAAEMQYALATDVDKKDKSNFFGLVEFGENTVKGLANFFASTPQVAGSLMTEAGEVGLEQRKRDDSEAKLADKFILDPGELAGFISRRASESLQIPERLKAAGQKLTEMNKQFIDKIDLKPTESSGPNKVAFDIGSAVGSIGTSIGLTAITKKPEMIAPLFGFIQKSSIYEEARSKGISPEQSSSISTAAGISEAALEFFGLHIFFNSIKASNRFARVALRSAEEAVQGGSQQTAEELITAIPGVRKDKAEDIVKRIGYATALGFVASAPSSAIITFSERQGVIDDLKSEGKTDEEAKSIIEAVSANQVKNGLIDEAASVIEKETSGIAMEPQERQKGFDALAKALTPTIKAEDTEGVYQNVINRFQSIENTVQKAKQLGTDIKPGENPSLSADRYLSISGQAENVLDNGTFRITPEGDVETTGEGLRPVLQEFDKTAQKIEPNTDKRNKDLDDYLIARRIVEDLQRPKSEDNSDFIASPEQVNEALNTMVELGNKYGDMGVFEQSATKIYDFQKRVLYSLVESGNMSQEQYDTILAKNPNYVPFDRVLPNEKPSGTPISKNRFSGARSSIKKIKGSDLAIQDPIESMIKNTYKILDTASRNKVFKDIYALKDVEGLDIKPLRPDMRPISISEEETGGEDITVFRASQFKPKGNVVEGYIDGKQKYLEVSKNLYDAMTGLDEKSSGWIVKVLSAPATTLRVGATITPEFILRNPIRDQWTALMQTHLGFKPFIDPAMSIADVFGKSEIYNDWIRSGGSYAGFVELSRPSLKNMVDDIRGNKKTQKLLKNVVMSLPNLSQLFEQATRLSVYKAAVNKGMSSVEASKQSRESTLDFARRGSQTKELNSMIAFFNAGVQSLDKSVRTIKEDPRGFTVKGIATITIPSLLLYLRNREEDDYEELPRWQRDLFWMLKVNDQWIRIPKPFLYGQVFGSLPERFFEYLDTKDPQAFKSIQESLLSAVSPIAEDPLTSLLPTALKPLLENVTNWSFFRERELVPQGRQDLIPSEQYNKYDTETTKALGRIFNVSPAKIENLVQGYFGGSGKYALQGGDWLIDEIKKASGEDLKEKRPTELTDLPVVKGFVAGDPVGSRSESVKNFYENFRGISSYHKTILKLKKEGEIKRAEELEKAHPEYKLYKQFNKVSDELSDIEKRLDKIIKSKTLSDDEKRENIKSLENIKTEKAKIINQKLKDGQ